jgi:hypothetical protein
MVLWLGVAPRGGRATFEVSVDGRRLGSQSLPSVGEWGDPRPIVLPLADYAGRAAEIAVRIEPLGRETRIDWRGATFGPAPASDVRQKPPRRTAR